MLAGFLSLSHFRWISISLIGKMDLLPRACSLVTEFRFHSCDLSTLDILRSILPGETCRLSEDMTTANEILGVFSK